MSKQIKKTNHYCYKIILAGSDKYYIGRRSTTKDIKEDSYMGSGNWVKSIKDKSRLTKIILGVYDTYEELKIAEEKFILEHFDDPNNMNILISSCGAASGIHNHFYGKIGELCPNYGKKLSEEHRQKLSVAKKGKYVGENSYNYGLKRSEETRQKLSVIKTGTKASQETRQKLSITSMGRNIGEKSGNAKLKESQVREILKLYAAGGISQLKLAEQYGVSGGAISGIVYRKTWKHIQ